MVQHRRARPRIARQHACLVRESVLPVVFRLMIARRDVDRRDLHKLGDQPLLVRSILVIFVDQVARNQDQVRLFFGHSPDQPSVVFSEDRSMNVCERHDPERSRQFLGRDLIMRGHEAPVGNDQRQRSRKHQRSQERQNDDQNRMFLLLHRLREPLSIWKKYTLPHCILSRFLSVALDEALVFHYASR